MTLRPWHDCWCQTGSQVWVFGKLLIWDFHSEQSLEVSQNCEGGKNIQTRLVQADKEGNSNTFNHRKLKNIWECKTWGGWVTATKGWRSSHIGEEQKSEATVGAENGKNINTSLCSSMQMVVSELIKMNSYQCKWPLLIYRHERNKDKKEKKDNSILILINSDTAAVIS